MEIGMCWRRSVGEHLRIIISDPSIDPSVYSVSISTPKDGYGDDSCIVYPVDLEYVKHDSFISYQRGILRDNASMDRLHASGGLLVEDNLASPELLSRIYSGALISDFISMDALNLLRSQGLVDS